MCYQSKFPCFFDETSLSDQGYGLKICWAKTSGRGKYVNNGNCWAILPISFVLYLIQLTTLLWGKQLILNAALAAIVLDAQFPYVFCHDKHSVCDMQCLLTVIPSRRSMPSVPGGKPLLPRLPTKELHSSHSKSPTSSLNGVPVCFERTCTPSLSALTKYWIFYFRLGFVFQAASNHLNIFHISNGYDGNSDDHLGFANILCVYIRYIHFSDGQSIQRTSYARRYRSCCRSSSLLSDPITATHERPSKSQSCNDSPPISFHDASSGACECECEYNSISSWYDHRRCRRSLPLIPSTRLSQTNSLVGFCSLFCGRHCWGNYVRQQAVSDGYLLVMLVDSVVWALFASRVAQLQILFHWTDCRDCSLQGWSVGAICLLGVYWRIGTASKSAHHCVDGNLFSSMQKSSPQVMRCDVLVFMHWRLRLQ